MFDELPFFPEQASTQAGRVDGACLAMLTVSAFFSALIAFSLIYFAVKYRRRSESDRPPPVAPSMLLELTWSLIPLAISLFLFVWGAKVYFDMFRPPDDAMEIHVVGKQWMWKVQHLGGQREINQLHVPVGRPIKLTLTSQDVIHGFYVPAFRIHHDVLPNRYVTLWFEATKPGRYHLFCTQYCGTNHARMIGEIIVMEQIEFQAWLAQGPDGSLASEGRKLFQKLQCVSCHSGDAKSRAPVLEGIYNREVVLQDGRKVRADEAYLRESILNPDAKIVAGFQPIMPTYAGQVNEEEILQLITFLKALGPGQTPRRTEDFEPPSANVSQESKAKSNKGKAP